MRELSYVVNIPYGLHARPAAQIAQCCSGVKSTVMLQKEGTGKTADASKVLQILSLGVTQGDVLRVTIEGADEEEAAKCIGSFLSSTFDEKKSAAILKIAFFSMKDYDYTFFNELLKDKGTGGYNCEGKYIHTRLVPETAQLANGCGAVCIFVNDECGRRVLEILHDCGVRLVLLRCAGFNNVDLKAAAELGITVLRVPAYSPYAVAEHAMAILQEANRRLHKAYAKVRENNFGLSGLMGMDLHNKTAGILGTGKIGVCFARICKGYGMNIIAWDAFPNQSLVDEGLLTYVSKEDVFRKADLISIHAPLIMGPNGTWHLIDERAIHMMKDDVMLVNSARGGLIDTEALIGALRRGKFHAVALDVYEGEDPNVFNDRSSEAMSDDVTARLMMFPQVVLTSHQAFFTREAMQAIAITTMENARNFNERLPYGNAEVKA